MVGLAQPSTVDRLVHHSMIIELNVECYRRKESKKPKKGAGDAAKIRLPNSTVNSKDIHQDSTIIIKSLTNNSVASHSC